MRYFKFAFIILVCCFISIKLNAQSAKQNPQQTRTAYYYSFEGAKSISDIENLKDELFALKGVTEFKPIFKSENKLAQIIVVVKEKMRTSEGDKLFEITDLKKILVLHGFVPYELKIENLPME